MNAFLRRASIILIVSGVFFNAGCKNIVGDFPGGPGGPGFSIITTALPFGVISRAYSFQLQVSGGGTATWVITSGSLPAGMTLGSNGVLSGTPTEIGVFSFVADATSGGSTATGAINLQIADALALPTSSLPNGFVGNAYSQNLVATGGIPGYTWALQSGTPPPGLSITDAGPGNATFGGTPTTAGRFTFTVSVTDAGNAAVAPATITVTLSLAILGAPGAFVVNSGDGTVSVVDITTNTLIATIGVGNNPQRVALSADSTFAFVTNQASNSLSIIDAIDNTVVATVGVGASPTGVVATANAPLVFVANQGDNTISIVDFIQQTEIVRITSPIPNSEPTDLVATPNGQLIFLSLRASDNVIVINNDPGSPAFHSIVGVIDVFDEGTGAAFANQPTGLGFSAASWQLFVANQFEDDMGVVRGQITIVDVDPATLDFTVGSTSIPVGNGPNAIGVGPDCNFIHVANSSDNSLSFVGYDHELEFFRTGGLLNPQGVAFSPDGKNVYVTSSGANSVSIFDSMGGFVGSFPVGTAPVGIAIQPDPLFRFFPILPDLASRVFPVLPDERMPDAGFSVEYKSRICPVGGIGPYTFTEVGGEVPPGLSMDDKGLVTGTPTEPSLSTNPDDPSIPHFPEKFVFSVDVTDSSGTPQTVTGDVQIRVCCFGLPDQIYVANFSDNSVSIITRLDHAVISTITDGIGANPLGVARKPDNTKIYVSNFGSGTVSVIDTTNPDIATFDTVTAVIGVGLGPSGMDVTSDGQFLYVANEDSNTVSIVNTTLNTTVSTVSTGLSPQGVALIDTAGGHRAYVPNIFSDSVTVIDTTVDANGTITGITTSTINGVGQGPVGIDTSLDESKVYVTNQFGDTVRVIDTATNTLGAAIPVGNFPTGIVVATSSRAYVANQLDDEVSVINLFAELEIDTDPSTPEIDRISVGASPDFFTASPSGFFVYVTSFAADSVTVILNAPGSVDDHTVFATVTVGVRPEGLKYQAFPDF